MATAPPPAAKAPAAATAARTAPTSAAAAAGAAVGAPESEATARSSVESGVPAPRVSQLPYKVGDRIRVTNFSGYVRFIGLTEFSPSVWVGCELDEAVGKNDGSVKGVQYFKCPELHGIFVRPHNVRPFDAPSPEAPQKAPAAAAAPPAAAAPAAAATAGAAAAAAVPVAAPAPAPAKAPVPAPAAPAAPAAPSPAAPPAATPVAAVPATIVSPKVEQPQPPKQPSPAAAAPPAAAPAAQPKSGNFAFTPEARSSPAAVSVTSEEGKALQSEVERLIVEVASRRAEISDTRKKRLAFEQDRDAGHGGQGHSKDDVARLLAETSELDNQEKELAQQLRILDHQRRELERDTAAMATAPAAKPDGPEKNPEESRFVEEILVEINRRELLELSMEELNDRLQETNGMLDLARSQDFLSDEWQIRWHHTALRRFYTKHTNEMRRLRQKKEELQRAQKTAEAPEKKRELDKLQREVKKLTQQNEELDTEANNKGKCIQEQQKLQERAHELDQEAGELQTELQEEIRFQVGRISHLEATARRLCDMRRDLKRQSEQEQAGVARMWLRLQALSADHETGTTPTPSANAADTSDFDAVVLAAGMHTSAQRCVSLAACLPAEFRSDAQLSDGFQSVLALQRCYYKANMLGTLIHEHYIKGVILPVFQEGAPLPWLCRTSLSGCLAAYASVSVIGRLRVCSEKRFSDVMGFQAVRACCSCERALDAALDVLAKVMGSSNLRAAGFETEAESALLGVRAAGAQLLALPKSAFKRERFASWYGARYTLASMRAVCALALFASDDACGSRRKTWLSLFSRTDRLMKKLDDDLKAAGLEAWQGSGPMALDIPMANCDPRPIVFPEQEEAELITAQEAAAAAAAEGKELPPRPKPQSLSQELLDSMLLQVSLLEGYAQREPPPDQESQGLLLDKALAASDGLLDDLRDLHESPGGLGTEEGRNRQRELAAPGASWVRLRESVSRRFLDTVEGTEAQRKKTEEELAAAMAQSEEAAKQQEGLEKELEAAGREFAALRIGAERFGIIEDSIERMRQQAQSHEETKRSLEKKLADEKTALERVEQSSAELLHEFRDLQQQVDEVERLMATKYLSHIAPEQVLKLRRSCARNRATLSLLRGQPGQGLEKTQWPASVSDQPAALAAPTASAEAPSLQGSDATDAAVLQEHWQRLRSMERSLLMEQAGAKIMELRDDHSHHAILKASVQEQRNRIRRIGKDTKELKVALAQEMRRRAGGKEQDHAPAQAQREHHDNFASVGFTRFLRATATALKHGPAATLSLPAPQAGTHRGGFPPVLNVLADESELHGLHQAFV